ncbi:hypothetical protein [Sphingobium sp.]|uniref:hypothetical protein n=1 Tax=Sphingobium sp. TaxID=1912891 RepID=UPI002C393124|nr:hypothetical protein [Sphingobium sp.]HUD94917.1 hypothetical protein [Sphingobium sp.]
MGIEQRIQALKRHIAAILNDDMRYAVAARIRELGYIDFRDFYQARPVPAHVSAVENLLRSGGRV